MTETQNPTQPFHAGNGTLLRRRRSPFRSPFLRKTAIERCLRPSRWSIGELDGRSFRPFFFIHRPFSEQQPFGIYPQITCEDVIEKGITRSGSLPGNDVLEGVHIPSDVFSKLLCDAIKSQVYDGLNSVLDVRVHNLLVFNVLQKIENFFVKFLQKNLDN